MSLHDETAARRSTAPAVTGYAAEGQDEISLTDIARALYARKWPIAAATLLAGAIAAVIAFNMTPIYRAEVLLAPVDEGGGKGGLSALAGQFGGLASLAGVNLGGGGNRGESVATLSSRALAESYIKTNNLLPILLHDKWDANHKQWKSGLAKTPTMWDAIEVFNKDVRKVADDKKNGLITLSIEWSDATLASQWANDLVKTTNTALRDRAIDASNRNLAYLNAQLEKTSVIELRQSIYRLIETEIKNVMVAQGSNEFSFKVIDPAVVPEKKVKPKRAAIVVGGAFLGFLFAAAFALTRRRPARPTTD